MKRMKAVASEGGGPQAGCDRHGWADAMEAECGHPVRGWRSHASHRELVRAAIAIKAWGLARRTLKRGMLVHGENAYDLVQLALCEAKTGRLALARTIVKRVLENDVTNVQATELAHMLRLKAVTNDGGWDRCVTRTGSALVLEPLDLDHADAFLEQYRDPRIAAMLRLPWLDSIDAVRNWIKWALETRVRRRYAVMHEDLGFIGYVGLRVSQSTAHFSFWTGVDYQGKGFGVQAGTQLCEFAEEQGVDRIFASAFQHNLRSISALERIGFVRLRLAIAADQEPRTFLCRSAHDLASSEAACTAAMKQENVELRFTDAGEEGVQVGSRGNDEDHR